MSKLSELRHGMRPRAVASKKIKQTKARLVLSLIFAAGALCASMHGATARTGPKVETKEGPIQGFINDGVAKFLGIPYAAPPVGNLRWMPPKEHASWSTVLQATSFGSNCPQNNENGVYAGPVNTTNESCLFLNVFAPGVDPASKEKLPVIFWIHGGGNMDGESTDYDGSRLAVEGHVVVVTTNFRLGSLGWLAVPALDAEGHLFGNYGLLDQQFALKWVRQNIAKFGGDPDNVTVGGQSFGSEDTEANMVSPLAKGMFQRAIFESEITEPQNLATAEAGGTAFANAANCNAAGGYTTSPQIAACLRALTVAQIVGPAPGQGLPLHNSLIGDGTILPLQPATVSPTQPGAFYLAFQNGNYNHMPVMSGTTEDEENFFLAPAEFASQMPYSAAQYAAAIGAFPTTVTPFTAPLTVQAYVSAHYPLVSPTPPGPQLSIDRLMTDRVQACPQHNINRLIASGPSPSPVYAYEFDDRTAPFYFPPFSFPFEFASVSHQRYSIFVRECVGDGQLPWRPGPAERNTPAEQPAEGSLA